MMKRLLRLCLFAVISFALIWFFLIYVYYPVPNHQRDDILLIEWGWDTPPLREVPDYAEQFQTLPFDGAIFDWKDDAGNLWGWRLFDNQNLVDMSQLDATVADLADFDWGNYTHNFLRYNINPGNAEWFDDWDVLLENAESWARFANELGFVGLMFDTEQYNSIPIFHYTRLNPTASYEAYSEQVYQQGQALIQAFNRGYPGLTVMLTFSISSYTRLLPQDLSAHPYGLLPHFIQGMIDGADDDTIFVDGYEDSYRYRHEPEFLEAYKTIKGIAPLHVRNVGEYNAHMQAGFGLWIDADCDDGGLDGNGCHFTRDEFEQTLNLAIQHSEGYVWIYSERINWYLDENIPDTWWQLMTDR